MSIECNRDYSMVCITDGDNLSDVVGEIVDMEFHDFIRTSVLIEHNGEENYMKMTEFMDDYLKPKQAEKIREYIRENLEEITEEFFGLRQVKSANSE